MVKEIGSGQPYRLFASVAALVITSFGLLLGRIIFSDSYRYSFLLWNLVLAAIPLALAWLLVLRIRKFGWANWKQIFLSLVWLLFLPNSFYVITDLIHLRANYEADLLFDIGLLMSFILAGLLFGYASVYLLHGEIQKRVGELRAYAIVAGIFLASSFAICLGRYTRWNTWDVILQPAGLLFDVSDKLIDPSDHFQTYLSTLVLFLVLFSGYAVAWEAGRLIRKS